MNLSKPHLPTHTNCVRVRREVRNKNLTSSNFIKKWKFQTSLVLYIIIVRSAISYIIIIFIISLTIAISIILIEILLYIWEWSIFGQFKAEDWNIVQDQGTAATGKKIAFITHVTQWHFILSFT